jgi:hypothetical protein
LILDRWKCTYDKTYNGTCDMPKAIASEHCYYHDKVVRDLIEVDEESVIREMPTMAN